MDGTIHWADGSAVDFMHWPDDDPDYPDDKRDEFVGCQSSTSIRDTSPQNTYPFVCQMGTNNLTIIEENPLICDVPFIPLDDRCIFVNVTMSTRDEAVRRCGELCSSCTLASIHNVHEINVMQSLGKAA